MAETAIIWNQEGGTKAWDNGNARTMEAELDECVRQINTARGNRKEGKLPPLVKANALFQAAQEDAARGMSGAEIEGHTPDDYADDHLFDGGSVRACYAQGSPNVIELCDALVKDEETAAVIDSEAAFIGVGLAGSQYNLRLAVYVGEGDPTATRQGKGDQALTEIHLRDGLQYGDVEAAERGIKVWVG